MDHHLGQMLRHTVSMLRATGWSREEISRAFQGVLDFVFGAEEEEDKTKIEEEEEEKVEEEEIEEEKAEKKTAQQEKTGEEKTEKAKQINEEVGGGEHRVGEEDDFGFGPSMADNESQGSVAHDTTTKVYSADDEDSESTVVYTIPGNPYSVIKYIVDKPRPPY
ncbi:hypothetical protein CONLIGDRAFT_638446 [Coniochaeta ligniaria NRRL 30616]|uniref:Uncharacterized protein n=1 Tax=Coniochaeta ligniaria NRRL 30616 TaxID=1408157 RepID=A0A1J7IMI0_9PEZI|nr:hypothetical protein CONLIGDRAFT_638446 [Coniochaeta ligniaria NRRL 30616]